MLCYFRNACRLAKKNNSICFFQKVLRKHDVLQKLLLWWQKCVGEDVQFDEKVVIILSESLALITRSQDLSEQQIIVNKFIEVFKSGLLYSNSFDNLDSPAESLLADSSVKISQEVRTSLLLQFFSWN